MYYEFVLSQVDMKSTTKPIDNAKKAESGE